MLRIFSLLVSLALPTLAQAQSPEDLVRWLYQTLGATPAEAGGLDFLTAPANRDAYLSDRLAAFYAANDTANCLDFGPAVPGNDFDAAEIARTLSLSGTGNDRSYLVTARFTNFGTPAEIIYAFVPEAGAWQLDDIYIPGGWALSDIPCAAAGTDGTGAQSAFCYATERDRLRLQVAPNGRATFAVSSFQANGHHCGLEGVAEPAGDVWLYRETLDGGGDCRLTISVTPEGAITFADADNICRTYHCGARAVFSGLTLPAAAQVPCAGFELY